MTMPSFCLGIFQPPLGRAKRVLSFGASNVRSIGSGYSERRDLRADELPLG